VRVVIAAVSSNRFMSGVSRHAANLVKCLLTRREITAIHLLVGGWEQKYVAEAIGRHDTRLHLHVVPIGPGTLGRNLWYYRELPAIARQLHADLVHIAYPSPIRHAAFTCPVVVTLHDFYPYDIPSNFGFPKVIVNRLILKQCLRNADAIACVSDSTKVRLFELMPQALLKAVTVNNCVEPASTARPPSFMVRWSDRPFLLCVAQHRRNKNIPVALRAFKLLLSKGAISSDTRLVLIGMPGPETGRIESYIRTSGLTQRVVMENGISDAEMNWCYRNCALLLAPSIVEGFGLPIVEGRLAGCRIVCSDIPAFRETGDAACRFVPLGPDCEREFAAAAVASLSERRPLPANLVRFSPSVIAGQYIRLYRTMIGVWAGENAFPSEQAVAQTENHAPKPAAPLAGKLPTLTRS
jgi:glycosyltransferase involved in cell wall biosynthesis